MQFPEGAPWSGEVGSVLRHALDAVDRIDETTSGEERITALADHLETLRATLATAPPV
jgi:hypothetical protein